MSMFECSLLLYLQTGVDTVSLLSLISQTKAHTLFILGFPASWPSSSSSSSRSRSLSLPLPEALLADRGLSCSEPEPEPEPDSEKQTTLLFFWHIQEHSSSLHGGWMLWLLSDTFRHITVLVCRSLSLKHGMTHCICKAYFLTTVQVVFTRLHCFSN